ncbi:MAG: AbrB/MazE/SpoVT family DNA-binding domain-containing protein [Candidatus Lokiarchaeota archaeon]|nr:AbrB/MazE/SpoVT family DNA-binding domain-containing protein [Candidatus Lokiarchaeota archaeon]
MFFTCEIIVEESKISQNGQITIPKDIREKVALNVDDKVVFEAIDKGILLRKKEDSES